MAKLRLLREYLIISYSSLHYYYNNYMPLNLQDKKFEILLLVFEQDTITGIEVIVTPQPAPLRLKKSWRWQNSVQNSRLVLRTWGVLPRNGELSGNYRESSYQHAKLQNIFLQ